MDTFMTSVSPSQFVLGDDGLYVGTILATTHGLGTAVCVSKTEHRNDDLTTENVILPYKVETNGDVKVFVSEPTLIRVTIVKEA